MANGVYLGAGTGTTKGLYHLDGNANDSSGNGNNGTATNVSWNPGRLGSQCAGLDGTGSITGIPNWGITSNFTCSVWFKTTSITQSNGAFVGITNQTPNNGSPSFGIQTSGGLTKLYFNKSYVVQIGLSNTLTAYNNIWYNFIVTYNGTTFNFYQNSTNVGTGNNSQTFTTSNEMAIGRDGTSAYLIGEIDEVIIENRVWSASEIQKYYTYAKGRFANL